MYTIDIGDNIKGLIIFFIWVWAIKSIIGVFLKGIAEGIAKRVEIKKP